MSRKKRFLAILFSTCAVVTVLGTLGLGGLQKDTIETWLETAGVWAPIIYIMLYTLATLFLMPSTPLNLAGGAIFGSVLGTLWTSIAAIVAAVVAFAFTRTFGRNFIAQKLTGKWQTIDQDIDEGGFFYIFSIRLIPILPYGLVNFVAGLTSIKFRDYFAATCLGTTIGVFPFVALGSSLKSLSKGQLIPFVIAIALIGILTFSATVYKQRKRRYRNE
jgi:uncharacterized membrane protein YdjX (TVP38/TMEM64 family)